MTESLPPRAFGTGERHTRESLLGMPLRSQPRPRLLESPIESLPGVGPATARLASRLGLVTISDLLEHLPFDHRDYESRRRISEIAVGEEATLSVTVRSSRVRPTRRRQLKLLECEVADDSGLLRAVWFNQEYLLDQLTEGRQILLRGKLESRRGGPVFRVLEHEFAQDNGVAGRHTTGLVPVYPATEGLSARRIRDFAWRVRGLERQSVEVLPAALRAAERLPGRADALAAAHFPLSLSDVPIARRRLALEELCLYQLALVKQRRLRKVTHPAERLEPARSAPARRLSRSTRCSVPPRPGCRQL
jgi:ATP-dependent DNA helicase RecG